LRSIPKRKNETHEQKTKVTIVDHDIEYMYTLEVKRWVFHRVREDVERDVIVGQSKPRKNEIENLIKHLNVDPKFAHERVGRAIEVVEVEDTMYGREEGTVKPASAL